MPEGSGVELVREEAGAFVRDLKSRALELKECRTLEGGCVFVTYQMRH